MDATTTTTSLTANGRAAIPKPETSISQTPRRSAPKTSTDMANTRPNEAKQDGVTIPYAILGLISIIVLQGGALIWFLASASKDIQFNKEKIAFVESSQNEADKYADTRLDLIERKMDKAEEKLKDLDREKNK